MKFFALISVLCVSLALAACGGEESSGEAEPTTPSKPAVTEVRGARAVPEVRLPPGPPPKDLVVVDLKKGTGAVAELGQRLTVQYVGVSYKTGKPFEVFWGKDPFSFRFGAGEVRDGWETGLKGLRVGGRRELILPSRLAYGTGALLYVVELVGIQSRRRS